jgi:hypothetical protein
MSPVSYWRIGVALLYGAACAYAGFVLRDSAEQPEVIEPAPEVRQDDGSVVLERDPQPASEPAPHQLDGYVEERRISVHVSPDVSRKPLKADTPCTCDPVRVDLSLVRDQAGGRRVVASSPDGTVTGGLDIPILGSTVPKSGKWAAGVSYDPFDGTPGAWIERDVGRIRLGADLSVDQYNYRSSVSIRLRVGWTF